MLLLLLCRAGESNDLVTWIPGLILIGLGEGLRLWAVAVIGKESRTRGSGAARLVTSGPYAVVRNPLYLGNLLLTVGATCLAELLWMIPVVIVLYAIQYVPIVHWEESILAARFGPTYAEYCGRVGRWLPRWPARDEGSRPAYQWRASFWSERSTLGTLALLLVLMVAKENLPHLPKYLHKHHLALPFQFPHS